MAVLVEALSVIVRNATLESLYPGGVSGYAADCPNRTFCSDGVLTRVGFMTPDDVGAFLERLETRGLVFLHDGAAADIAVVDQHEGPTPFATGWRSVRTRPASAAAGCADPRAVRWRRPSA